MEYSLIKFAMLLTSSVERLSIHQVNPRVPVWLEFDHISTFDIGKLTLPKVNARFDQFCAKNHLSTFLWLEHWTTDHRLGFAAADYCR